MTLRTYATVVAALAVALNLAVVQASAGKTSPKTTAVMGTVTSVSGASLVVESGKKSMTFAVDPSTRVVRHGATSKTREKQAAGAGGLVIGDVVHSGDYVTVRYTSEGGAMHASEVRVSSK